MITNRREKLYDLKREGFGQILFKGYSDTSFSISLDSAQRLRD